MASFFLWWYTPLPFDGVKSNWSRIVAKSPWQNGKIERMPLHFRNWAIPFRCEWRISAWYLEKSTYKHWKRHFCLEKKCTFICQSNSITMCNLQKTTALFRQWSFCVSLCVQGQHRQFVFWAIVPSFDFPNKTNSTIFFHTKLKNYLMGEFSFEWFLPINFIINYLICWSIRCILIMQAPPIMINEQCDYERCCSLSVIVMRNLFVPFSIAIHFVWIACTRWESIMSYSRFCHLYHLFAVLCMSSNRKQISQTIEQIWKFQKIYNFFVTLLENDEMQIYLLSKKPSKRNDIIKSKAII